MPHPCEQIPHLNRPYRKLLLHSKALHITLFTLLVIDGLICLMCGVLETHYLHGSADDCKEYVNVCSIAGGGADLGHRLLGESWQDTVLDELPLTSPRSLSEASHASSSSSSSSSSSHGSSKSFNGAAGEIHCGHPHFGNHDLHTAELYMAYVSIGILSLFFIEQIMLIVELRGQYFSKPMFVLDMCVIVSSLLIEVLVTSMTIGGLLVLARTWRFARVGHGVIASMEEVDEIIEESSEDDTFKSLQHVWSAIPEERWTQIAKGGMSLKDMKEKPLTEEERAVCETLGKSEHVALRAIAMAKMYQNHSEKKRTLMNEGSSKMLPLGKAFGV